MRASWRTIGVLAVVLGITAACGGSKSPTAPGSVSLAGNYTLKSFSEAGTDLSQAATGSLTLTATRYSINIQFLGGVAPAIVDSGTYTATSSGSFSETSSLTGQQAVGTYTNVNGLLTVSATSQSIPIVQSWQKQ